MEIWNASATRLRVPKLGYGVYQTPLEDTKRCVLDENGKVDAAKLNAFAFDPFRSGYYAIGDKVGQARNIGAR